MSARSFPTNADFLSAGSPAALDNLTTMTLAAWIYPTTVATTQMIWSKNASTRFFRLLNTGKLTFVISRTAPTLEVTSTDTLVANQWQFVVMSMSTVSSLGTDQYIYVGSLTSPVAEVSAYDTRQNSANAVTSDAAGNWVLASSGAIQPFTGRYGWVQAYNRQLSLGELRMLQYRSSLQLSGCVGFWRPGWDAGTTVPDLSGSGHHATVNGAPTYVAGLPLAYVTGNVARMPYTAVAATPSGGKRTNRRRRRLILRGGIQRRLR